MLNQGQHLQQKELHDQRLFQDVFLAQYYNPGPSDDPSIALDYGGYYFQTFDNRDTCWQQQLPTKQVGPCSATARSLTSITCRTCRQLEAHLWQGLRQGCVLQSACCLAACCSPTMGF